MKTLAVLLCLCLVPWPSLPAQDPPFYRKQDTWQETMRLSREAFAAWLAPTVTLEHSMLGPWYVIGPFVSKTRSPFYDVFPPERKVDLNAKYGHLIWMRRSDWKDNQIIDFPPTSWCDNYLYRTITARHDTTLTLYLGSDDGVQLWVNGTRFLADSSYRPCAPNQDTARVTLKKGKNALLLKISNGVGATAFYFSLTGFHRDQLWDLAERDFPGMDQLREMRWERTDSIWEGDWKAGDVRELGRRYARAYQDAAEESGVENPDLIPPVRTPADLARVRALYEDMRKREMTGLVVQIPREKPEPRLTGPRVFGVRPGHPFLFRVSATGDRPMSFGAHGLPAGLTLDSTTGQIHGTITARGEHRVVLKASNAKGTTLRDFRIVVGDRIALTPPLGWNSWNCFADAVSDEKVRQAADAMVKSGLVDHGWAYINIDDCWMVRPGSRDPLTSGVPRDARGRINTNAKFPDMHALANYVHARGLKLGIYSSPGPLTCAGYTGSYQHELDDARQYAEWGIDYLKFDWCSYGSINRDSTLAGYERPYRVMRAALDSVDRDIVYSLCQYGMMNVWEWGDQAGGNCWRTTGDIEDTWKSMSSIGFSQDRLAPYAGPGHWNDPDMLVVGWVGWGQTLKPTRLSPNEQLTHITLWSLLCAPMLIGCDMTRLDDFTYSLLSNDEVLDINQDPLGRQAHRVVKEGETEVWVKEMEDGSRAVGLFNRGTRKAEVTVPWTSIGITGPALVRDPWRQRDLGTFRAAYHAPVPRHGTLLLRITQTGR